MREGSWQGQLWQGQNHILASQTIEEKRVTKPKQQKPQGEVNRQQDFLASVHYWLGVGVSPLVEKTKPTDWPLPSCRVPTPSMAYSHSVSGVFFTQSAQ